MLGEINECLKKHSDSSEIATHMFAIMVRGIFIKLNFPFASFPCRDLNGHHIASILMEATFRLEKLGFKVMAHTMDGSSKNRKYFRLMGLKEKQSPKHKMKNPFTTENRYIYFLSDPPHLMKTTRNCFQNPRRELKVCQLIIVH